MEATLRLHSKLVTVAGALALAVPGVALAAGSGNEHSGNANAYGKFCKGESKKHVDGQKGTPFSICVTAMAKLDHGSAATPKEACEAESKKHVKGMKGTPFSQCVKGGRQLEAADG